MFCAYIFMGMGWGIHCLRACHAHIYAFYFWLNPKVTKDQEPIKGDFAFGKPRTLFTAPCFYRGSGRLWLFHFSRDSCYIGIFYVLNDTRERNSAQRAAITADGFGPLFLILNVWDV